MLTNDMKLFGTSWPELNSLSSVMKLPKTRLTRARATPDPQAATIATAWSDSTDGLA